MPTVHRCPKCKRDWGCPQCGEANGIIYECPRCKPEWFKLVEKPEIPIPKQNAPEKEAST